MPIRKTFALIALFATACARPAGATDGDVETCADRGAPEKAIAACSHLIESGQFAGRDLGSAHFNRGVAFSRTGDQDRALVDFDAALRLIPGDPQAYGMRGVVHGIKGELDAAIADFTRSIEGDPTVVDSFTNRGKALQDKGEHARAIADMDRALELQPDNPFALNGRCWSRAVLNIDLDGAIADCNAGVDAGGEDLANILPSSAFASCG